MSEIVTVEKPSKAKRLAVFLDGTTDKSEGNTNVWRARSLCAAKARTIASSAFITPLASAPSSAKSRAVRSLATASTIRSSMPTVGLLRTTTMATTSSFSALAEARFARAQPFRLRVAMLA